MTTKVIELIASVLEIAGALYMANALLGLISKPWRDVPRYLASALVDGKLVRGVSALGGLSAEDYRKSLRGLAFIVAAFALKFCVAVSDVIKGFLVSPPAG